MKNDFKQKCMNVVFDAYNWLSDNLSIKKIHGKHKQMLKRVNQRNKQYHKDMDLARRTIINNRKFMRKLNVNKVIIYYPNGSHKILK